MGPRVPIFIFIELFFSPLEMAGYKWVSGVTDPNISGIIITTWYPKQPIFNGCLVKPVETYTWSC